MWQMRKNVQKNGVIIPEILGYLAAIFFLQFEGTKLLETVDVKLD